MYVIPCHRKYSGQYNQCVIQVVYDGKVGCTVPLKSKLPLLVSFLMSRETRVSSRENHWSVYFGTNWKPLACEVTNNFSRCGEVYPAGGSGFAGCCLACRFKRTNFNFQAKNFNESAEKQTAKTFTNTSVRRSLWEDLVLWALFLYAASRESTLTYKRKTSLKVTKYIMYHSKYNVFPVFWLAVFSMAWYKIM